MSDAVRPCPACGARGRPRARFCAACGAPSNAEVRARGRRRRARLRADQRAAAAIAAVFAGTILALVITWRCVAPGAHDWLRISAVFNGAAALAGLAAAGLLGKGALRASFARVGAGAWILVGAAAGALGFGFSYAYVDGLHTLAGLAGQVERVDAYPFDLATVLAIAVLPALFEEWLDRGVLWNACQRVTTPTRTIWITALLFTFMHGVGGSVLAYPHRFALGMVAGWLRQRSGSLLPGVVQHFVHNLLCVGVA